jgi:hypothetical protein
MGIAEASMLTTRASKRDNVGFFNTDIMLDIVDGDRPIGSLVYDKKVRRAALTLGSKAYTVERVSDRPDELVYQALTRVLRGGEKPPANPWALKDGAGTVLALGDRSKQGFAVSRGEENFSLRKIKRPYHLFRHGSEQSLGWVGQEKFFTRTLHMDLPTEFDAPFQVFLLVLLLNLVMERQDSASP